jgi:hypothetical protein
MNFGYMVFSSKDGNPQDSFYIVWNAVQAIQAHRREFGQAHKIELIVLNPIPYFPETECEVKMVNGQERVTFVGHGYARCYMCMDFFKESEVACVKPFGYRGYTSACEYCTEMAGLKRE